ncbi:PRC-barrel domain-containing protein [Legionella genomosp. 1]|uniref:PRC-barrel domain-containing protein n=1 Tax=Legionella genomosp. 1 TaxID=1093625 RepID=UPI0021CB8D10|nr:PRC-barrel domain-containing protein [Legionella genomosp. 1]
MERPHEVVKASEVTGVKVKNLNNDNLGEINEIVLDKISGSVNYLVLDSGGMLGFGNKFFAMPWKLFSYDEEDDCFVLNLDKEILENAPGFDKDHWPNFATPEFSSTVENYYKPHVSKAASAPMTTELFHDRDSAEKAYLRAIDQGYKPEEISVLMSDDTREKYYDSFLTTEETGSKAVEGMGVGGLIGGTVGATLGAIAAIGTNLIFPGLGLIVAGPIAAGLAGAGAGSISGGLIGALIGWGIPEERAKVYEKGLESGGIVLGVENRKDTTLENDWRNYSSNKIH